MADRAGFHRIHDRIGNGKDGISRKTGHDFAAAVNSVKFPVFPITAELQSFLDDGREILVLADVAHFRVADHLRRKDAVRVAGFRRHETVGGKKNRGGQIGELFLLILPGRTEVAFKLSVFFQLWIGVGGKHLPVGIDVDAFSFGLL